ncbi:MAG TPA: DUF2855 family protein [Leptospiraceae bacterium]|nr:DUF2855 family protein [Leptospiraceae bacterium]HMW06245.1 DUF2855 family protein [Leptospiraceae bacterium]HMX34950.1 DUF2855 family protein [Leptospiraceae bacterium]HMY31707.1 DUF2855 family protein [Leptospiraceae bacterium]HMZ65772.1 DUF2855 family protein [Leptospiraceae bacterium]
MNQSIIFKISKDEFTKTEFTQKEFPTLQEGQILLEIYKFAFTANNITYVNLGESVGYWNFFPEKDNWGVVPVWGFGKVIESKNENIPIGEKFYGYYPTASHVVLNPNNVKENGFVDSSEHRSKLPSLYNYYSNVQNDTLYTEDTENIQLIYRPLFTTAFLIKEMILSNKIYNAKSILLTSASSKTGLALADLLFYNRNKDFSFDIIGLTSERNLNFIKNLEYFQNVFHYKKIDAIPKEDVCIIDFSGNKNILSELNSHFGEKLKFLSLVGMVHWEEKLDKQDSINGTVFFAPTQIKKTMKELGPKNFQKNLSDEYNQFIHKTKDWIQFEEINNAEKFKELYLNILSGKTSPEKGYIVSLNK